MTFLGLAEASAGDASDITILGAQQSVDYPGVEPECAEGPAAVRRRSQRLASFVEHWDFDLDGPMLPAALRIIDGGDVSGAEAIEGAVRSVLAAGAVPIVLGGDDSVPIPVLRAYSASGPINVLQVDAHLDFRDEVRGVREGYSSAMRRASEMEHVGSIVQVGMRGPGSARPADLADAHAAGNAVVPIRQLRARGTTVAIEALPPGQPVFVSFDLDALDPSVAPGVRASAPGGMSFDEACELLRVTAARAPIAGAAFTEFAPALDVNHLTALVVVRLITHLIAGIGRR